MAWICNRSAHLNNQGPQSLFIDMQILWYKLIVQTIHIILRIEYTQTG